MKKSDQICKLNKDKNDFKRMLESAIEQGENLIKMRFDFTESRSALSGYSTKRNYTDEVRKQFFSQYKIWTKFNSELLKQSFDDPENEYKNEYEKAGEIRIFLGIDIIKEQQDIIEKQITSLKSLINILPLIQCATKISSESPKSTKLDISKVFIVHGHDTSAESQTARFLEQQGLEAVILHEQANVGQTIIEKIETNSDAGFGIVLYTPCDKGALNHSDSVLKPRARQNVVFEHGYLIGKIGRNRVCALVKDSVETPGDISGVVYVPMDNAGLWKYKIANEMKAVGYEIDLNKIK